MNERIKILHLEGLIVISVETILYMEKILKEVVEGFGKKADT
ncbi:hypothetical protein [Bacillus mesophilus]|nr:hypothetical protein [Bacillus mesophilus]